MVPVSYYSNWPLLSGVMRSIDYSVLRGLKAGALGGLAGAVVLGVLAGLSAFVLDQEVFYVTIATKLGLSSPVLTGWALHFLVGLVAGGVFIAITALLKRFALDTTRKSFWVGLLGGIAIWIVVYVPIADLLAPTDLSNLMFAGGRVIFHLVSWVGSAPLVPKAIPGNVKTP